ncbi:MAG TPA: class II aldolase/adducin family protein [Bryobacteraceae bacterium]|nr:class II aldolase/adducin family protein [Bryobacteraceae bacterium]
MSKLFETLRRLEKDPDGVALDNPVQTLATMPAIPPPLPAPVERPALFGSDKNLSIQWPAEPMIQALEDPPTERTGSRILAIGIDAGMIVIALALFVGVFFLSGGILTFERDLPLLVSVLVILALFYCFLCLLANQGSPGMNFAGVRGNVADRPAGQGQLGLRQIAAGANASSQSSEPLTRVKTLGALVRPIIEDLVTANKILANENVLEAYGSVSVRDERNSDRFYLARQVNGNLVSAADVTEYHLDGIPVSGYSSAGHPDCSLHSEIYKTRPDVMAIVHWRASDIIPFTASSVRLRPVSQNAAFLGEGVPVLDTGKTDMSAGVAVRTRASAKILAEALSDQPAALLRGQGAIVVAPSLHGAVARAYYMNMNARLQIQAIQLGGEVNYVAASESPVAISADEYEPAWEFWKQRLPVNGTHH